MSKRITGDFDMTPYEQRLFNESVVQAQLAEHYQKMADMHTEQAVRTRENFWTEIKKRNLPVHCKMVIHTADRKLRVTKVNEQRAVMEK